MVVQEIDIEEQPLLQQTYENLVREQLELLGHDTEVDGLAETPGRVARFHSQYFLHYDDPIEEATQHLKPFDAPEHNSLVAVRCSFSAFCEHHLLPFFGTAQVVYLPDKKITGLSKISRVLTSLCGRPQIQERITSEAAEVMMNLDPVGVLVDLEAEHTCMKVRGIGDPCSSTRTRIARGAFEHNANLRNQAIGMLYSY
jgi:GTP cyclohydrolase IA